MNITIFKDIVLNTVLITFPILLYLLLTINKERISQKYNDILIHMALITSLYLVLRFGTTTTNNEILLFCNVPIIIAFIKRRTTLGVSLSLINIIYCFKVSNILLIITTIKYLAYFILYLLARRKSLSTNNFLLSAAVLQGFFLSFEYFFSEKAATINDVIILLILVFSYYFITFFIVYMFGIIEKVQKLNTTIQTLEKDKKIKDGLFKLTHEIKNPLAVCKGYLEMIDLDKKEKAEKYIKIMREEIDRSLNIMTDFIQFNKIKIVKKEISINTLLEDVYNSFKIIAKTNNIKITYKQKADIHLNGDYDRLKQVLINILKNSIEAINEDGKIEINTLSNKDYLEIIIKDNGVGISKNNLKNIKEMFYTTKENGTGLGVALSNEIVEAHNGKLNYESKENKGTIVTIKLPIV